MGSSYIDALREVRALLLELPSGVDMEADENNTCSEDATAHIGGLCVQIIDRALGDEND